MFIGSISSRLISFCIKQEDRRFSQAAVTQRWKLDCSSLFFFPWIPDFGWIDVPEFFHVIFDSTHRTVDLLFRSLVGSKYVLWNTTTTATEKVTKPTDQSTNPRQDGGRDRRAPLWPRRRPRSNSFLSKPPPAPSSGSTPNRRPHLSLSLSLSLSKLFFLGRVLSKLRW